MPGRFSRCWSPLPLPEKLQIISKEHMHKSQVGEYSVERVKPFHLFECGQGEQLFREVRQQMATKTTRVVLRGNCIFCWAVNISPVSISTHPHVVPDLINTQRLAELSDGISHEFSSANTYVFAGLVFVAQLDSPNLICWCCWYLYLIIFYIHYRRKALPITTPLFWWSGGF